MKRNPSIIERTETHISTTPSTTIEGVTNQQYRTMLNQSVRKFTKTYGPKAKARKKKSIHSKEKKRDKKEYYDIIERIQNEEKLIQKLERENAVLQAQIKHCNAKIKAYPRVLRRYNLLSKSLQNAHSSIMKATTVENVNI